MLNLLYFYINTFPSMCAASSMAVFCSSWFHTFPVCCLGIFCMILRPSSCPYYHWYHICFYIPHALYFYCKASFFITFLSHKIATSISIHVPLSLSRIMMSSLLLGMVLSFSSVDSIIWLPCLLDVFLLILAYVHTSLLLLLQHLEYW